MIFIFFKIKQLWFYYRSYVAVRKVFYFLKDLSQNYKDYNSIIELFKNLKVLYRNFDQILPKYFYRLLICSIPVQMSFTFLEEILYPSQYKRWEGPWGNQNPMIYALTKGWKANKAAEEAKRAMQDVADMEPEIELTEEEKALKLEQEKRKKEVLWSLFLASVLFIALFLFLYFIVFGDVPDDWDWSDSEPDSELEREDRALWDKIMAEVNPPTPIEKRVKSGHFCALYRYFDWIDADTGKRWEIDHPDEPIRSDSYKARIAEAKRLYKKVTIDPDGKKVFHC